MREIKFRAWEKNLREMIPVYNTYFESKIINKDIAFRFFDEIELMQDTGLKDKNGKEIFEGDIIKYSEHPTYGSLLEFNSEVKITPFGILIKSYAGNEKFLAKCFKYCEVIGNIYENKELI